MTPILTIKGLTKSFGPNRILRGVDFEVFPSDVVAIIGASGSGKTTLLRCIDLLEEFEAGEIRLDGEELGYRHSGARRVRLPGRQLAMQRAKIAMVFQTQPFPHLTALGNVMIGSTRVSTSRRPRRGRSRKTGSTGSVLPSGGTTALGLGGQQQRVAIARALAMEPRLLLLDEVTSALDPELVQEVLLVIRALAEAGTTMLIVTHEMRFARQVRRPCSWTGAIVEQGPPANLRRPKSARLAEFLPTSRIEFARAVAIVPLAVPAANRYLRRHEHAHRCRAEGHLSE
jgi:polar amino acid transport system ATP-binding protein